MAGRCAHARWYGSSSGPVPFTWEAGCRGTQPLQAVCFAIGVATLVLARSRTTSTSRSNGMQWSLVWHLHRRVPWFRH